MEAKNSSSEKMKVEEMQSKTMEVKKMIIKNKDEGREHDEK